MRAYIVRIGLAIYVTVVCIFCASSSAEAVTPQEGWYVVGEDTAEGIPLWVISTSGNTTGDYFTVASTLDNRSYTLGGTQKTGYWRLTHYWRGFSTNNFRIDSDWFIKITVQSSQNGFGLWLLDYNNLPQAYVTTDLGASGNNSESNYIETKVPIWFFDGLEPLDGEWDRCEVYMQGITLNPQIPVLTYTSNIDINDLVICGGMPHGSNTVNGSAKIAIVFGCPKDKAPPGISIGDEWPKTNGITVNVQQAISEWETKQLAYSNMLNQLNITNTTDAIASKTTENTLNAITAGSLGQFELEIGVPSSTTSAWLTTLWWIPKIFAIMCTFGVLGIFIRRSMHD